MTEASDNALARLTPLVYVELKKLAGAFMRGERRNHTLQPTALVHEAYLRLSRSPPVDWQGETHFKRVAAQQMWRILVDHAKRKRGPVQGGHLRRVTLDEHVGVSEDNTVDVLALDAALNKLMKLKPRHVQVVTLRFLTGLTVEETAKALDLSPRTVVGDWRVATAWLRRELAHHAEDA
jgi:RNA polymerase sigma-70 factor (ECF subfamily)